MTGWQSLSTAWLCAVLGNCIEASSDWVLEAQADWSNHNQKGYRSQHTHSTLPMNAVTDCVCVCLIVFCVQLSVYSMQCDVAIALMLNR